MNELEMMKQKKFAQTNVGESSVTAQLWDKVAGKERVYVKEYRRGGVKSELVFGVNERSWIGVEGYPCRAVKNAAANLASEILGYSVESV